MYLFVQPPPPALVHGLTRLSLHILIDQSPSIKTETEDNEDWQHVSDYSLGSESDFMELQSADGKESVTGDVEGDVTSSEQFIIRLFRTFEHPRYVLSVQTLQRHINNRAQRFVFVQRSVLGGHLA